jgi:hypothetical protein
MYCKSAGSWSCDGLDGGGGGSDVWPGQHIVSIKHSDIGIHGAVLLVKNAADGEKHRIRRWVRRF